MNKPNDLRIDVVNQSRRVGLQAFYREGSVGEKSYFLRGE